VFDQPPTRLDEALLEAGQRPGVDPRRQDEPPPQIPQVVREHAQQQPDLVRPEPMTRESRPVRRLLPLLDPLLGGAALVLEGDDALGRAAHVGDDVANARIKLAWMLLDLGNHPARLAPTSCLVGEVGVVPPDFLRRSPHALAARFRRR
jgi:hypothetical protein